MIPVRDVPLLLPGVLVHAGAVLVVLLPVPLVAVLALVAHGQQSLEFLRSYMLQKVSVLLLIFAISSSAPFSSGFKGWSRRERAASSGRSTYRTSPPSTCRPTVTPSTAIATSVPATASVTTSSPFRIDRTRPRGFSASPIRGGPGRQPPARPRAPRIARLLAPATSPRRDSIFAGYGLWRRRATS